jgi:hypothetical protein
MTSTYVVLVLPSVVQSAFLLLLIVVMFLEWRERRRVRKLAGELKDLVGPSRESVT